MGRIGKRLNLACISDRALGHYRKGFWTEGGWMFCAYGVMYGWMRRISDELGLLQDNSYSALGIFYVHRV